ncbi:MAG: YitT family protein, partial [Ileibacterium sp.]|nr:YitT family protein [Ileibacterium sp.]
GWIYAAYSIIFQFLSTNVINRNYKRYAKVTMEITCQDPQPIIDAFMDTTRHGMSVIEAKGGYSGKTFYICKSVVAAFEVQPIIDHVRQIDPHSLVNVYRSMDFYGNFYQKPIE